MEFESGAIHPIACLRSGWQLVRDRYVRILAITTVGLILGSFAPLGVLLGPMLCGIYMCLLGRMRGEEPSFRTLFRGFEHFLQSLVATLIQIVPMMAMTVPINLFFALLFVRRILFAIGPPYDELALMLGTTEIVIVVVVASIAIFFLSVLFGTFFMFSYPLIVERKISGWAAVKLSARASKANFAGAAVLMALTTALSILGSFLCYVGAFMITPITLAAWTIAYRKVFPAPPAEA